jgi:SHS2 domain-containing protein
LSEGPTHSFEEHTGEVLLKVTSATLPTLFEEAGRALAELMAEQWTDDPAAPTELVVVGAPDRDALLFEWLNELLFRSETQGRVYPYLQVTALTHSELQAKIRGALPSAPRTAVKAATYHRLQILQRPEGYTATIVLDV